MKKPIQDDNSIEFMFLNSLQQKNNPIAQENLTIIKEAERALLIQEMESLINQNIEYVKTAPVMPVPVSSQTSPASPALDMPKDNDKSTDAIALEEKPTTDGPQQLLPRERIRTLSANIKTQVFGQDDVIEELVDVLKVASLNIKINKDKPAGCYFLAGPSGCGKTELALALAAHLSDKQSPIPLLKLNMGEYGMENDVTKLIGPPPGYKGFEHGGVLTNFVRENPISIILFDEIEKAHESIDKILLNILDKGICADNKGEEVSFKNTIVLSTSNLGAEVEYDSTLTQEEKNQLRMEVIKSVLRPEIINRYDSIFHCHSISQEIYKKILEKFLTRLQGSIKQEHSIELTFSKKLVQWAAATSYDPAMGGRPAARFIEKIIIKPLADHMIEGTAITEETRQIHMDINKAGNIVFKDHNKKVLGTLPNTAQLVQKIQNKRFSNKP